MSTVDPRDRSIEQLLRQSQGSLSASDQCVDGETLAAWVEGALPLASAASVENHLADCARCQALLATFVRAEPPVAVGTSSSASRWWHLRWLVPLATAATAVALWVRVPSPPDDSTTAVPSIAEQERVDVSPSNSTPPQGSFATLPPPRQSIDPVNRETDRVAGMRVGQDAVANPPEEAKEAAGRRPDVSERILIVGGAPAATTPVAPVEQKPKAVTERATADDQERRQRSESSAPAAPAAQVAALSRDLAAMAVIVSPDVAIRWRIVEGSSIERSSDAGATWSRVAVAPGGTFVAGHAPSAFVAWVVGRAGAIRVTTDGTRFESVSFPEAIDLVSVIAIDERQATVTTVDGRRFSTSDRGVTWAAR